MNLRPYQNDLILKLREAFKTKKSPVIVLGCGGGKSIITGAIAKMATDKGNKVLFLVHRIELVEQIRDTFFNIVGVNEGLCDIIMVQSAKKYNKDYKLIITDESHHSTCATYQNIYDRFPNVLRVNVTATPCRTDGRGLGETCDCLIQGPSTKWLIENHYLAPYQYYSVTPKSLDLQGIKKIRGEYEDISWLLDKPTIYGDVFKYYKNGEKTICYCSSLSHSINTSKEFNERGISSAHLDGNTPKKERKEIIEKFRKGEILVLCNFSLIAEGFDVPDCETVMILRKTASLNLFIQMSMRCMRYKEGKIAKIYDFCGNCNEHGLPDDDREWTLDKQTSHSRNPSGEKDVLCRTCKNCFLTYAGNESVCPYCGFENGKTEKQIKIEKEAELQRIEEINKKIKRCEVGKCRTKQELEAIAKERGYKRGWVYQQCKIKHIPY